MTKTARRTDNRDRILKAACALFLKQGFNGTSTREIADKAGVSLGNIYNHFSTKEDLFVSLLKEYEADYFNHDQPLARTLAMTRFPENLEAIGEASKEVVERFSDYILLTYVDVVEFDAKHIGKLFQNMRERYSAVLKANGTGPLREGVDPAGALMMVVWGYFNYFIMEKLFKVQNHYGMKDADVVKLFARVYRRGIEPDKK
ncbi:MAG: TetR/AcrR family transcriptional regulator [Elusimicrobia bacterium]|nr:TetR/AcrR family transcriptional regulator [Elusimicrobiota bacterium]